MSNTALLMTTVGYCTNTLLISSQVLGVITLVKLVVINAWSNKK